MLGLWTISVILGLVAARGIGPPIALVVALATLTPLASFLILATLLAAWRRWPALLVCVGCLHGFAHAAPSSLPPRTAAEVVAVNLVEHRVARVLVTAGDRVYEVDAYATLESRVARRGPARPGLFAPQLRTRLLYAAPAAPSLPIRAGEALSRKAAEASRAQPRAIGAFVRAVTVGDGASLAIGVKDDFRAAGIFHLLIVSGQHVTLVALFAAAVLGAPARVAYALRLIPPHAWPPFDATLRVASVGVAAIYAGASGFSAATQRAVVLYAVWQLGRVFFGVPPPARRLVLGFAAQAAMFPIGLIGPGTTMSWAAYLLIAVAGATPRGLAWAQAKLAILTAAVFGELAPLGVAVNLLLVPVFTAAMAAAGALVLLPGVVDGPAQALIWAFLEAVAYFATLSRRFGRLEHLSPAVRAAFLVAAGLIVLNTLRRVTISRYEQDRDSRTF